MDIKYKKGQKIPSSIKLKRPTLRNIKIKQLKVKDKEKFSKGTRGKMWRSEPWPRSDPSPSKMALTSGSGTSHVSALPSRKIPLPDHISSSMLVLSSCSQVSIAHATYQLKGHP